MLRRLLGAAPNAIFIVVALVAGWFLWPTSLGGCTTLTIVTGHSMEPTYYTGDLVLSRCGIPEKGDVIVYQPASIGGARIIHRVIGGDAVDGWAMQGDNNEFVDQFTPKGVEVLGTARLHVPKVGLAAAALTSPLIWLSVILLAVALLLWPRSGDDDDEESVQELTTERTAETRIDGLSESSEPADHDLVVIESADVGAVG